MLTPIGKTIGMKHWRSDPMTKWHGGKGSSPRPINPDRWDENYERIFGKRKKRGQSDEQAKEGK